MRPLPRLAATAVAALAVTTNCTGDPASPPSADARDDARDVGRDDTASKGVVGLPLDESLDAFLDGPNATHAALLSTEMGLDGSTRWAPYLVDLLRLGWSDDSRVAAEVALEAITGVPRPDTDEPVDAYLVYGEWLHEHEPGPDETYREWKQVVYGLIDPEFATLLSGVDDASTLALIQWGGVLRGGIPALDDPAVIGAGEASVLLGDEVVFGAVVEGEARAWPLRIMGHHELTNDTLGGRPVALAYCTLCRSAVLFDREVAGQVLDFDSSGLLLSSNKVMADRQTDSLWRQLGGVAIGGELTGAELTRYSTTVTTWSEWQTEHPDTTTLAVPDPEIRSAEGYFTSSYSYEPGDAYREYNASDELWFPALTPPPGFSPKADVATVLLDGEALAVRLDDLEAAGPTAIPLGTGAVLAVPTGGGARFYDLDGAMPGTAELVGVRGEEGTATLADGTVLPRLSSGQSLWFAWWGEHRDSDRWPGG